MISPYVRRLRLASELQALRDAHGLTQAMLAKRIGKTRSDVSRLESGHSRDQAAVLSILDVLGVEGDKWEQIFAIAREASQDGWWDTLKDIGERQALIANLESGAKAIRSYEQAFMPGLLQTPEFVQAFITGTEIPEPLSGTLEGILAGRTRRQQMQRRPGGPAFEVVVDEVAVYRLAAPPSVVKRQLLHMAEVVTSDQRNISLRVLPTRAEIAGYTVPRSAFTIYTYPDPDDPVVVAVDTVTTDLILTAPAQVAAYEKLYERLRDAALDPAASAGLLSQAAGELPSE
jgi:transcriptional regulator with XRE-family HTH domain